MERQIALRTDNSEQDLIAVAQDGLDAMVQILYVRGGRMVGGDHFALPREGGEDPGEVIAAFAAQYYEQAGLIPRNVLCQTLPEGAAEQLEAWLREKKGSAVTVATPQRGEKHELVLLAVKNAEDALLKRNARRTVHEERTVEAAKNLGKILGMDRYPRRIEGYDISNTQGEQSVAAMVVFIDGEPAKKEYRHFRIKTVEGANDFESLYETLKRRYAHAAREEAEGAGTGRFTDLPDLILIDGGPQQLRFARQAILDLGMEPPAMFGLAEREEEIWLPDAAEPICAGSPDAGTAAGPAGPERGAPLRHHPPPGAAREGFHPLPAGGDPGHRPAAAEGAAEGLREPEGDPGGIRRRTLRRERDEPGSGGGSARLGGRKIKVVIPSDFMR